MAIDLQLDGLSVAQKIQLLEKIWADLCQESGDVRSPEWHAAVLEERKRKIEGGTMPVSPWNEAKKRLMKLGE
jgi:putative addiction module component (TIGR02574 family)